MKDCLNQIGLRKSVRIAVPLFGGMLALAFSSCAPHVENLPDPLTIDKSAKDYENPYPVGTYDHFLGRKDYPATYEVYRNEAKIAEVKKSNSNLIIDRSIQRGKLFVDDVCAMDFPCSTGIRSYPTKAGEYRIISKLPQHYSNLYGKFIDAEGKVLNSNVDMTRDTLPEGATFSGSSMPYWMRLTNQGLGMHVGKVRRKPLSHGCIRLQREVAKTLYKKLPVGFSVEVK